MDSAYETSAAQRDAPELRDAVGHLRIQTGGADGGGQAKTGLHQIDGYFPAGQLGVQVQKLFFCPEGAQKIVTAAVGQTAHGGIFKAVDPGKSLVEGAVTARGKDAQGLPRLPGLFGRGMGQLPGVAGVGCGRDGIILRRQARPGGRRMDLFRQRPGAVGLARRRIQEK